MFMYNSITKYETNKKQKNLAVKLNKNEFDVHKFISCYVIITSTAKTVPHGKRKYQRTDYTTKVYCVLQKGESIFPQ